MVVYNDHYWLVVLSHSKNMLVNQPTSTNHQISDPNLVLQWIDDRHVAQTTDQVAKCIRFVVFPLEVRTSDEAQWLSQRPKISVCPGRDKNVYGLTPYNTTMVLTLTKG